MSPERDAGPGTDSVRDRRRNVLLAGHIGDPEAARASLGEADPMLRVAALSSLARAGDLSVEDLQAGLRDADPGVRRRSAELAVPFPDLRLTDSLLGLLDDPDFLVAE